MLKSFLHQSSDIYRAINEAWEQSERPTVFTVKIIDAGKKGFLGFAHRDAIISFTYECSQPCAKPVNQLRQVTSKPETSGNKNPNTNRPQPGNIREPKKQPQIKATAETTVKPESKEKQKTQQPQRVAEKNTPKPQAKPVEKPQAPKNETNTNAAAVNEVWNDTLANEATAWVEGFFKVLGTQTTVQITETKNELLTLSVTADGLEQTLAGSLFKDNLFACASATLAVQSLRNKNSQRFKGLKIKIIT